MADGCRRERTHVNDVLAHLRACRGVLGGSILRILGRGRPGPEGDDPRAWIKNTDFREREFTHLFYRIRVTGLEDLDEIDGPVLFTPNHCLHLDNAIILTRLPLGTRWKLSVAAAADTIYGNPVQGVLASIIANAFPLAREGGVRKSLELLGARLDRGFNILLYPEGKLTLGGPLQPFKAGAGLIAVEGGTPVVPVKIVIHEMSWIDKRRWPAPLRGDVELVVGKPIWFDADTDHAAAATRLEAAVGGLS